MLFVPDPFEIVLLPLSPWFHEGVGRRAAAQGSFDCSAVSSVSLAFSCRFFGQSKILRSRPVHACPQAPLRETRVLSDGMCTCAKALAMHHS